jgi:hypothetical protein
MVAIFLRRERDKRVPIQTLAEQRVILAEGEMCVPRTEVLQGTQNVIAAEVQFFSKAQTRVDTYMNHTRPPEMGIITPSFRQLHEETISELKMELQAALVNLGKHPKRRQI